MTPHRIDPPGTSSDKAPEERNGLRYRRSWFTRWQRWRRRRRAVRQQAIGWRDEWAYLRAGGWPGRLLRRSRWHRP